MHFSGVSIWFLAVLLDGPRAKKKAPFVAEHLPAAAVLDYDAGDGCRDPCTAP
jgi:hypothetical protein